MKRTYGLFDSLPVWDGQTRYLESVNVWGRNCWIKSSRMGFLCGYAEISKGELSVIPKYEEPDGIDYGSYDFSIFDVHGGITLGGQSVPGIDCQAGCDLIGFDCGHVGDLPHPNFLPDPDFGILDVASIFGDGIYRDEQYVLAELVGLVAQIEDLHIAHNIKAPGEK